MDSENPRDHDLEHQTRESFRNPVNVIQVTRYAKSPVRTGAVGDLSTSY